MFKILNGYEHVDRNRFPPVKENRRTRGHEGILTTEQCGLDIRKLSYSQRTVNRWTRLTADCVGASNVNMHNKLNHHISQKGGIHLDR